jgi:chemotaxis protein methyltransferase CheR
MTIGTAASLTLSQDLFHELRDIIYEKSGIFYAENKLYLLESRLGRRIRELEMGSFEEYVEFVRKQTSQSAEFHQIYNAVTINETFFFRFQAQLESFRKLVTDLTKVRLVEGNKTLNIWSAASSTGEEVYSNAIILREVLGASMSSWKINMIGTDISHRALKVANDGVYGRNSFRGAMTPIQKERHFTSDGNLFRLNEDIKIMTNFRYLNLNDSLEIRKLDGMDFVFCRNVMIYFDEEMKKRVLRSIYGIMNHGAYFFLGEAESLHGISSSFKVEHFAGSFAYKKE